MVVHKDKKIWVNINISILGFYGYIENIDKISMDIFTKISVIKNYSNM